MKTPSTGNLQPSEGPGDASPADSHDGRSHTRSSVDGEASPLLPHERDESSDSGTRVPDSLMKNAHADAASDKVPTDKSEESNAVYEQLRGPVPGPERDQKK